MNEIQSILLALHVGAGFVALGSGITAAANKIFELSHRWHIVTGRAFFWSMLGVFGTAVPISVLTGNVFLLLIALFSFYLAWSGWCYARNRSGLPTAVDWLRVSAMLAAALAMAGYGVLLLRAADRNGITLLVFAGIGAGLSLQDLRILRSGGLKGPARIAKHLTMMLGGTIATITAFLVVNIKFHPAFVVWLAPTVLITPIIVWMNIRVLRGAPKPAAAGAGG
ncbi:MAG TPA: hypothetical protein VLI06_04325 [Solimonas sp.]|nr:hypothetical protein [Solimonas sp.]